MPKSNTCTIIANFGGPRDLNEVELFLTTLLTDKDVIRTRLPQLLHNWVFGRVARKRALTVREDYAKIGGGSPIYADTEAVADWLRGQIDTPVYTFHRYLPKTQQAFLNAIRSSNYDEYVIFPMFPQFTYATTGSVARWFTNYLPKKIVGKMSWIRSYASHPAFIRAQQSGIQTFLDKSGLKQEETVLLFSAHGIPKSFVKMGDVYQQECEASFRLVMKAFPKTLGRISYQSQFGPEEWIQPYTRDVCKDVNTWHQGRPNIVFVPISFTSDHVETLFEVEEQYMTVIREQGLNAWRAPALNRSEDWLQAIVDILDEPSCLCNTKMLLY